MPALRHDIDLAGCDRQDRAIEFIKDLLDYCQPFRCQLWLYKDYVLLAQLSVKRIFCTGSQWSRAAQTSTTNAMSSELVDGAKTLKMWRHPRWQSSQEVSLSPWTDVPCPILSAVATAPGSALAEAPRLHPGYSEGSIAIVWLIAHHQASPRRLIAAQRGNVR
jgi:hypothetical protein